MNTILTTRGLCFSYGKAAAVSGLDLTLQRGDIFGFVGPNGAGKTTTIKLLLGLLTPTSGTVEAFGLGMHRDRLTILRRIGALVETPSLYGHLTADENLRIQAMAHGVDARRRMEVLELVALQQALGKKVRHFSLGMKQRLGVAMALLHRPELLVLDEPSNGLDPEGIQDLRRLLKRLAADQGLTVFLSSHILAELEQTATKVAVITGGSLRYHGTIEALRASQGGRLRISVDRVDDARALLRQQGHEVAVEGADTLVAGTSDRERSARITAALVGGGIKVYQAVLEQPNLEEAFLEIVRRHDGSVAS